MIHTDNPSPQIPSFEKHKLDSSAESEITLDVMTARYPEVSGVAEMLKQATIEARHAFGLTDDTHRGGDSILTHEITKTEDGYDPKIALGWLKDSRRGFSDAETRNFDAVYFMDAIANEVTKEAYDTLPEGVDINALLESFMKYVLPTLSQQLEATMPVGFRRSLLEAALGDASKESDEKAVQTFVPSSDLITPNSMAAIGEGAIDTAAVFSYRSAEGDASEREELNHQSHSANSYGESLRDIIRNSEPLSVYKTVEYAGQIAKDTLGQYQIEPSSWTLDGAWALWDMGKRQYFASHPAEQEAHIRTQLDRQIYSEPVDFDQPDKLSKHLAERQIGWEVVQGPQSAWCLEIIGSLFDQNKDIDAVLKAKVEARRNGEDVHFKSSELSYVGRLMLLNAKHDDSKARN